MSIKVGDMSTPADRITTTSQPRTRRNERGTFADSGAVKAAEGKLPIYDCTRCGAEVCWATSSKTGRKYLVNVRRYRDHVNGGAGLGRWYDKSSPHNCEKADAERAERQAASQRLAMLADLRDTAAVLLDVSGWAKVRAYFEWAVAKGSTEIHPVDAWLAEFENVDGIINYLWRELA